MGKVSIAKMDGANLCEGHVVQLTEHVALNHPEVLIRMSKQRKDYMNLARKYQDLRTYRKRIELGKLEEVKTMSVWEFIRWRSHTNLESPKSKGGKYE